MLVAATLLAVFFERATWYLVRTDPALSLGWWKTHWLMTTDSGKGLLPSFAKLFGSNTVQYLRPGFSPAEMGSTAQAVAYLASSPAARGAQL